jgi:signal transduction histidine kinase/CheY-like chemotaxis protein/HPt (histidine-containing phosphotransfer) domain-containing protein
MKLTTLKSLFAFPELVRFSPQLEREYREKQRKSFVIFFRSALLFGSIAYILMIAWDAITASKIFMDILTPRLTMIGLFLAAFAATFHKRFHLVARVVAMAFIMVLMSNVLWIQSLIEKGLEEGYGMLITPGAATSIIVFSGAEMGYGALLTPLLLLPIAFTGFQAFIVSALVIGTVNFGMRDTELPSAFVQTANSIFISIGVFTTILAFLVNQHRRAAFKLQYDLLEANRVKSSFLATMSHEVRTPLSGMVGMSALLLETPLNDKQQDYLQTIKYSSETLLAMLNDILDFSKMEAGKFEIEIIDIDFHRLISSVADLMSSRAHEKNIDIKINMHPDVPPYIRSDPTRLRQVLLNLLSNAIKFTDHGDVTIAIALKEQQHSRSILRFEVIDTGVGMPEDVLQNLFKEYAQADSSTSRKYGGTGLGLSICKQIIHLMGGDIRVTSTLGQGSTFWFEIPADIIDGSSFHVHEQKEALPEIEPLTILMVEDDKTLAKYTATLLQALQHHVYIAESGQEALEAAQKRFYDVVLMDYNLPDMKGSDITRALFKLDIFPQATPIVGLTANTQPEIIDECYASGMVGYLIKPVDKAGLMHLLAQYGTPRDAQAHLQVAEVTGNTRIDAMINDFGIEYAKEMVNEFVQGIAAKIEELEVALQQSDSTTIIRNAHDIASMSGTLGLERSSGLFKEVEKTMMLGTDIRELYEQAKNIYLTDKRSVDSFLQSS